MYSRAAWNQFESIVEDCRRPIRILSAGCRRRNVEAESFALRILFRRLAATCRSLSQLAYRSTHKHTRTHARESIKTSARTHARTRSADFDTAHISVSAKEQNLRRQNADAHVFRNMCGVCVCVRWYVRVLEWVYVCGCKYISLRTKECRVWCA